MLLNFNFHVASVHSTHTFPPLNFQINDLALDTRVCVGQSGVWDINLQVFEERKVDGVVCV